VDARELPILESDAGAVDAAGDGAVGAAAIGGAREGEGADAGALELDEKGEQPFEEAARLDDAIEVGELAALLQVGDDVVEEQPALDVGERPRQRVAPMQDVADEIGERGQAKAEQTGRDAQQSL